MSKKLYEESNIQSIAEAIRDKNGTQNQYTVSQMPDAVRAIKTQPNLEILNATENRTYLPSPGKDGFSSVTVNVDGGTSGGTNILSGLDAPNASAGTDGDIYLQYDSYEDPPSGYEYLEYIATGSASGAYINTGLSSSPDIAVELVVQFTAAPSNNKWFYGAFQRYGAPILGYQSGRVEGYIVTGGAIQGYDSQKHKYRVDTSGIYVDNIPKQSGSWSSAPQGVPLFIFARGGDISAINNTRIYSCKMWDNGTLVRDFVASKRTSDDVLGFYDRINNKFYVNAGSQSFLPGGTVSGKPIINAYVKNSSAWENLIGSDIDDVV